MSRRCGCAHSVLHRDPISVGHVEALAECEPGQLPAQRAVLLHPNLEQRAPGDLA
jgi:hypothetical protein